ncbi:site-specific integrase [Natranaeroarchaeum aerophilus]|uniref:Site-specific integrase n=1 Tax=Natranaeroarchaeum aerophilus TaxID=2917711 RepID=A0AAE3FUP6_9EURY|nr:site-specific integrase [Natranaeroarchaeum aerophilus]MCL9815298.1 site-specific integrase [Natranaeroarchaeum aerophilus]
MERHLGHVLTLREQMDTSITDATKYTWTTALQELEQERDWTSGTKRNYQKSIRSLLEEVEDDVPTNKDDISLASDDSGGKITEDDVLTPAETRILIQEASNRLRDKAMFALAIDCGLRVAALCSLRIQDFDFTDGDPVGELSLNEDALGQKGSEGRTQVVTFAAGFITNYLRNEHPRPDVDDAPLFHKIGDHWDTDDPNDDGSIAPVIFRRRMKRLAKNTDIDPEKLHPHNLKHAAVTIWAIRGMSTREIEHRAGWARESGQLDRYEHIGDDDVNNQILETFGIDTEDGKGASVEPIEACPQCGVSVDTAINYCPTCGQKLSQIANPDWFEDYEDEWGEDGLIAALQASPSKITTDPADLPQELRLHYQDRIEQVIGESLRQPPIPEEIPLQIPDEDGHDHHVTLPYSVLTNEEYGDPDRIRQTVDGYMEILDEDGSVMHRHDPIHFE